MLSYLKYYQPTALNLWKGRQDTKTPERFFQSVSIVDLNKAPFQVEKNTPAIIGFCSEEGIRRNQGRLGAKDGPDALRTELAKLAYHGKRRFKDLGNIVCKENALEEAQEALAELTSACHEQGSKTLIFGGGHEIAFGHFKGLAKHYSRLAIINFDAHFDLRPLPSNQLGTSGTPFQQIAQYCKVKERTFFYACLGIQEASNTAFLFEVAKHYQVPFLSAEEINRISLSEQIQFLDKFLNNIDAIYLSICMDVFAEAYAPGVSAPQPLGLTPWQVLPLLKYLVQTGKVVGTDLAELSPPLDESAKTARLAAMIAAETLREYLGMKKSVLSMAILTLIAQNVFAAQNKDATATEPQSGTQQTAPQAVPKEGPVVQLPSKQEEAPEETNNTAAPMPANLDCNYKIPADKKQVDSKLVVQWSKNAVQQAFDLDFNTLDEQLKQLKNCFTDQGWQGFNEALEKSGNLKAIQDQKLTMTNTIDGEAKLAETKENQWKVNIPLQVVYQNDKEKVPQELTVDLLVGRKISGDLGILQMIASPRAAQPKTAVTQ